MTEWKLQKRLVIIVFVLSSAYVSISHLAGGRIMLALLGPVSLLFLLIPPLAERLFRMRLGNRLYVMIMLFCLLGFNLGTALRWYDRFAYVDKISHFLSGFLFVTLGLCFFAIAKKGLCNREGDLLLQISYAFFFSMFVAVVWETGEYLGYLITGHDAQHTVDTGVHDTMQDIIACFLGSLVMIGDYYFLYIRKRAASPLVRAVLSFDVLNGRAPESR